MSEMRTLVSDYAHVLEAGNGAYELEIFGRISKLLGMDHFRFLK